jgi:hypothetical protein
MDPFYIFLLGIIAGSSAVFLSMQFDDSDSGPGTAA